MTAAKRIDIPQGMKFADLKLFQHGDNGDVSMDMDVIQTIETANDLAPGYFANQGPGAIGRLLVGWYRAVRREDQEPADPVFEALIAAIPADDGAGGYDVGPQTVH